MVPPGGGGAAARGFPERSKRLFAAFVGAVGAGGVGEAVRVRKVER